MDILKKQIQALPDEEGSGVGDYPQGWKEVVADG